MQHVNNHMDDLFKRAAEGYPLNTDSADWSKVAAGLQNNSPINVKEKKGSHLNRSLFLLLFIALPFLCNEFIKINAGFFDDNVVGQTPINSNNETVVSNDPGF